MGAAGVPAAVVAPQLHPPLRGAWPREPPLQCSIVGRPVRARGIPIVFAGPEGRLGRAEARGARYLLMSLCGRSLVGVSVAASNVRRARRPLQHGPLPMFCLAGRVQGARRTPWYACSALRGS